MVDSTPEEVSLTQYVPTDIPNVIDHFICKLCNSVVFQPKECSKCEQAYCFNCTQLSIANQKKWKCPKCNSEEPLLDMHRVIKEVLDQLIFKCPKCA